MMIPAGHGRAVRVEMGQKVKVINTHGTQAIDYWALNAYDLYEYMNVCFIHGWSRPISSP